MKAAQDDEREFARSAEALGPDWDGAFAPLVRELLMWRRVSADLLARFEENPRGVGARGQEVKSPVLEQLPAVSTRAHVVAESLLLSPRARKRAGKSSEPEGEDVVEWLHRDDDD